MMKAISHDVRLVLSLCTALLMVAAKPAPAAQLGNPPPGFSSGEAALNGTSLHYVRGGRGPDILAVYGTEVATMTREAPGMSAFALEDGIVYHTYSAYVRGLDGLWGMYQWLDRAPRGRNEMMVRGLGDLRGSGWYRRHDEYEKR